jgi:Xaa-Pro aminopeptidase
MLSATLCCCLLPGLIVGQEKPVARTDFSAADFAQRRARVLQQTGEGVLALVQGAPAPIGWRRFRQSNEFHYLTGLEVPNAHLLLDGVRGRSAIYLPHRNEARERSEGRSLSAQDADLVRQITGADAVFGNELLGEHLARYLTSFGSPQPPALYTPLSPAEGVSASLSAVLPPFADNLSNPWMQAVSREAQLVQLLRARFPQFEVRDLSPILNELRLIKSPKEIALIRRAAELAGQSIMEAMRSTKPSLMEYELDALSKFVFFYNGAQTEAYRSLIANGRNAYFNHYYWGTGRLQDGDLVLLDHCPDVAYYVCDVTRQFPVNGKFSEVQRELYGFYLASYKALMARLRPGATPLQIMQEAARDWDQIVAATKFSTEIYQRAARRFVDTYRDSPIVPRMGHWIGMAVHDVGAYRDAPLQPGMVITIEPEFRIPEQQVFIRLEDTILITPTGAENLSGLIPMEMADIEKLMREEGILKKYPPHRSDVVSVPSAIEPNKKP